jgi:hypothetical protein
MRFPRHPFIAFAALVSFGLAAACGPQNKETGPTPSEVASTVGSPAGERPVPRSRAFFGLHFDLHPNASDTVLGADISEDNIRDLLRRVRPDFVQYDCKGHAGYAGYPTEVGWASPGIVKDSLAVWRKVTREEGVGLYIHYSGVWDFKAVEMHPEWARVDAAGKRDPNATSVFGPYVDELLIPQLREAATRYDLDGVWVDGDCWGARLDWSPRALEAWRAETGEKDAPRDESDPRWLRWKMFHRRAFERYLVHWVDALHASHPRLQVTSNWMYTSFAPQPIVAKVDFLSGDYSWSLSVDRARVEARYLASTGMPWDLMAWGFTKSRGLDWSLKHPEALKQEAAVVLMQGGGFQIYNTPTRSGFIIPEIVAQEEAVAAFCRARQAASHQSATVPQVALLNSSETLWERMAQVYAPGGEDMLDLEGALHALLHLHYSVDILAEHQLEPRLDEFPLVVVPDAPKLAGAFRKALLAYVERGGSLLLLGEKCARIFESVLGAKLEGPPAARTAELASSGGIANANGVWQKVTRTTAAEAGRIFPTRDTRRGGETAATITALGRGKIAAVYGPLPAVYFNSHHPAVREFIGRLARELFPMPAVEIEGPAGIDVALRRTADGRLALHLLHTGNMPIPDRYDFSDSVPVVENVGVKLRVPAKPKSVTWVPDGGRLPWSWRDGVLAVTIPRLHIHGVLVVD